MRMKKLGLRLEILDSVGTKASLTDGSNSSTSISTDEEKRYHSLNLLRFRFRFDGDSDVGDFKMMTICGCWI